MSSILLLIDIRIRMLAEGMVEVGCGSTCFLLYRGLD